MRIYSRDVHMYVCMHIHVGHAWNVNLRSHLGNQVSLICALHEDIDRLWSWAEQHFLVMEDKEDSGLGFATYVSTFVRVEC